MSPRYADIDAADREAVAAQAERELSSEEFAAYVDQPMSPEELTGIYELLDWFERKYPTPAARLAYARAAYARWTGRDRRRLNSEAR